MHFVVNVIIPAEDFGRPVEDVVKEYKETGECPEDLYTKLIFALAPFDEGQEVEQETEDCWACDGDIQEGCDKCNGTGKISHWVNPDAEWDWWDIGGRWGAEGEDIWIAGNSDVPSSSKKAPYSVLVSDRDWIDLVDSSLSRGERDKSKMETMWHEIAEEHKGDIVIRVDCHI